MIPALEIVSRESLLFCVNIFRQSQENQKEMKVMLDVYKCASKDNREKLEVG